MIPSPAHGALALALTGLAVAQGIAEGRSAGPLALAVLGTASVALSRSAPVAVAAATTAAAAGAAVLGDGDPAFASFLAVMAACYALGRRCARLALVRGLSLVVALVAVLLLTDPTLRSVGELVFPLVYFGGATGMGRLVRSREHASAEALRAAVAASAAREAAAVAAERARIAREMHDVVAHEVSLLVLQAESAAAVLASDPQRALLQVERVAQGGRQALDELRRLLGVLRAPDEDDAPGPQPGLDGLEPLAAAVRGTGVRVALDVEPGLETLAPGLQLTAYRVVQESFTNALRHGRAQQLSVQLRREGDELLVQVVDDGTAADGGPAGHGLLGMRERLRLYDGDLTAGPAEAGGWRVSARAKVGTG